MNTKKINVPWRYRPDCKPSDGKVVIRKGDSFRKLCEWKTMTRRNLLKSLAIAMMLPVARVFGHEPDALPDDVDCVEINSPPCCANPRWEMTTTRDGKSTNYVKLGGESFSGEYHAVDGTVLHGEPCSWVWE